VSSRGRIDFRETPQGRSIVTYGSSRIGSSQQGWSQGRRLGRFAGLKPCNASTTGAALIDAASTASWRGSFARRAANCGSASLPTVQAIRGKTSGSGNNTSTPIAAGGLRRAYR